MAKCVKMGKGGGAKNMWFGKEVQEGVLTEAHAISLAVPSDILPLEVTLKKNTLYLFEYFQQSSATIGAYAFRSNIATYLDVNGGARNYIRNSTNELRFSLFHHTEEELKQITSFSSGYVGDNCHYPTIAITKWIKKKAEPVVLEPVIIAENSAIVGDYETSGTGINTVNANNGQIITNAGTKDCYVTFETIDMTNMNELFVDIDVNMPQWAHFNLFLGDEAIIEDKTNFEKNITESYDLRPYTGEQELKININGGNGAPATTTILNNIFIRQEPVEWIIKAGENVSEYDLTGYTYQSANGRCYLQKVGVTALVGKTIVADIQYETGIQYASNAKIATLDDNNYEVEITGCGTGTTRQRVELTVLDENHSQIQVSPFGVDASKKVFVYNLYIK